jgi:hypothetical protein
MHRGSRSHFVTGAVDLAFLLWPVLQNRRLLMSFA